MQLLTALNFQNTLPPPNQPYPKGSSTVQSYISNQQRYKDHFNICFQNLTQEFDKIHDQQLMQELKNKSSNLKNSLDRFSTDYQEVSQKLAKSESEKQQLESKVKEVLGEENLDQMTHFDLEQTLNKMTNSFFFGEDGIDQKIGEIATYIANLSGRTKIDEKELLRQAANFFKLCEELEPRGKIYDTIKKRFEKVETAHISREVLAEPGQKALSFEAGKKLYEGWLEEKEKGLLPTNEQKKVALSEDQQKFTLQLLGMNTSIPALQLSNQNRRKKIECNLGKWETFEKNLKSIFDFLLDYSKKEENFKNLIQTVVDKKDPHINRAEKDKICSEIEIIKNKLEKQITYMKTEVRQIRKLHQENKSGQQKNREVIEEINHKRKQLYDTGVMTEERQYYISLKDHKSILLYLYNLNEWAKENLISPKIDSVYEPLKEFMQEWHEHKTTQKLIADTWEALKKEAEDLINEANIFDLVQDESAFKDFLNHKNQKSTGYFNISAIAGYTYTKKEISQYIALLCDPNPSSTKPNRSFQPFSLSVDKNIVASKQPPTPPDCLSKLNDKKEFFC